MMRSISLTRNVNSWLENSQHPRILHIFDHACNLMNEQGDVLSIVTPQIGNGPFNLVVEDEVLFSKDLHIESSITISGDQLHLGNLTIDTQCTAIWNPRPEWEMLHTRRDDILDQISKLPGVNFSRNRIITYQLPTLQSSNSLPSSLALADLTASITAAKQLAGLGIGLTPSGDDFILGAIYAAWIFHPFEIASKLADKITSTAAPLTTSLSAAWLRSAGKGEAGILWHEYFAALMSAHRAQIQRSMDKILAMGETSGADALAGFVNTFERWEELTRPELHSFRY